jgi:cyclophilin family peptidyl-prolyl cis-trans isomerase
VTKAKAAPRTAAPLLDPEEDLVLPETWKRRPWIPYLIIVAILAVIIGSGLAMNKALQPAVPNALSACKTSSLIGPHAYIARQPICILPNKKYTATISTTQGDIVIDLLPQYSPVTVNNFVVLAVNGYYNGLSFWDSQDWEVQAGDPLGNGQGGPGYNLPDESTPMFKWTPGAVGMARVPGGPVNGSQFFIIKTTWPNGPPAQIYNRFGTVRTGLDKISAIAAGDRINTVTITVTDVKVSASR